MSRVTAPWDQLYYISPISLAQNTNGTQQKKEENLYEKRGLFSILSFGKENMGQTAFYGHEGNKHIGSIAQEEVLYPGTHL